jgi:hypothetical protein
MRRTFGRAAVALAFTALLAAGCSPDSDGTAPPETGGPLRPGAELNGMRLTTANAADKDIFVFCDPYVLQPGTYARDCEVPQLQRLMIGYGSFSESPESLELEWQASRWRMYLDGREVDLEAFGTLADRPLVDAKVGDGMWLRVWAVTIVNPTPGPHTLRYVAQQSSAVDTTVVGTNDTTWTFTVTSSRSPLR